MTGTLLTKTLNSGSSYYYVRLNYKDSRTNSWKQKTVATKLAVRNNKRKAEAMIPMFIDQYSYLEDLPMFIHSLILISRFVIIWIVG